jgi:hypothetical protein
MGKPRRERKKSSLSQIIIMESEMLLADSGCFGMHSNLKIGRQITLLLRQRGGKAQAISHATHCS